VFIYPGLPDAAPPEKIPLIDDEHDDMLLLADNNTPKLIAFP
jgi:hypothetical protein